MLRLVSAGRNNRMVYFAVTVKPQLVSYEVYDLCGQFLFGRFNRPNFVMKQDILGKEWGARTRSLKVGEFIYQCGDKREVIKYPEYKEGVDVKRINQKKLLDGLRRKWLK